MKLVLYQTPIKTPYVFRSWSKAKDKFDFDDYVGVYVFTPECTSIEGALEEIFEAGNVGELPILRSVSVSDVVIICDPDTDEPVKAYYCDPFNWEEISDACNGIKHLS